MDSFERWQSNVKYKKGQLRVHGDGDNQKLYRCNQDHTSQDDWTPDHTPALWSVAGDPTVEYPPWSQPLGAHDSYALGAKCSHVEKKWTSDVDGNIWEPGVYGWTEVAE